MRCDEVMTRQVKCVSPSTTVQQAARLMETANIGFLPVCGADRKAIGVLTDRDIAIRLVAASLNPETTPVRAIMTEEVIACRPDDELERVEEVMEKFEKSRLLVCREDGHIEGIISLSDVVQQEDASQAARTMRRIADREAPAP